MLFQLINLRLKDELKKWLSDTATYLEKNPHRAMDHQKPIKFYQGQLEKLNSRCYIDLDHKKLVETFFEQFDQFNLDNNYGSSSIAIEDIRQLFKLSIQEYQKQVAQLNHLEEENRKLRESLAFIAENNLQKFVEQMQTVTSQAHAAARQATEVLKGAKQGVSSPAYSSLFPAENSTTTVNAGVASAAAMDTTTPTSSPASKV